MKESLKLKKRQLLRNNEYYTMQNEFDNLYNKSCNNKKFTDLMQYIISENNILLAYRNIKKNKGSTTVGTDNLDISFFKDMETEEFVERIQNKLANCMPKSVRRVEIPKHKGSVETRPLGIPCIEDRIIQQCIKQVLEPISEAKFHKHSYGFRPNRSTEHAIARSMFLMNKNKLHYVVDIDVKGFFDNVNHSKLKRQMWNLGIQDKNLISIIGKILKSEIQGIGVPTKGTPQGGIISPLLSNIVLNELDWWVSSQWETFGTKHKYGSESNKYREIKKSNLKEVWLVRYADDFKIFCRDYKNAQKIYNATRFWLKERLDLDISPDKSKITNLRKNYTEFLGFKLMVKSKRNKYVCQSRMCNKAKKNTINKLKEQIKRIQKHANSKEVLKLNSMILGSHNYYNSATYISLDFSEINFLVKKTLEIRLKQLISDNPKFSETYKRLYGNYNGKIRTISDVTIFPIYGCKTKPPMNFSQDICNYTKQGREKIHKNLSTFKFLIDYLLRDSNENNTAEFNDNRISLIAGQYGKCYITGLDLEIGNMECHHKKQKCDGGTDEYKNLVWIRGEAHKIIHCTKRDTIEKYLGLLALDEKGLKRVNSLRKLVGNSVI
ncbi:group II intron reverse transcriptase/maturase [Clostridium beijerinckii]|uniref:Group II intron reverse transcriptase/maturase n=1 Tax=Clostridium beijerinckii TaxID=1520 RepID=A0AAE5H9I3_CLOBE|nr:group II intron reverse transcriptase/maturase [Clostridium beijerinckii]NSB17172.1 group II intron reverse transcriptase/maturase [Clostridium beijerinckii]OOM23195.1 group II intron-encoded protein LtrA [Clostridium beijerinckii]